jgi:hypothetical protein
MANDGAGAHFTAEELLDYFESRLGEARERAVEEHLGSCSLCAEAGREVYAFHEVWQWPAERHGRFHLASLLQDALATAAAEAASEGWRRRLEAWRRAGAARAEAALQVAIEASEKASRAAARMIDSLSRPDGQWRFVAESVPAAVRGPASEATGSAVLTTQVNPGMPRARIAVHAGERGEIVVRLDDVPREVTSPLILLISIGGALTVRVAEASFQPGRSYRIARFTDVAPGDYVVAFEPRQ